MFVVTSPWVTGGNLRSPLWGIVRGGTPKASFESCGDHLVRPPPHTTHPHTGLLPHTDVAHTEAHRSHSGTHNFAPHEVPFHKKGPHLLLQTPQLTKFMILD